MCLHFWHIYHLSPSYILIAPERITVPLRVRRIPRCFTRTLPMRGKVSNQIQTHSHTNQTNNYPSKELKQNQYHREKNRKKKPGHSSGEPLMFTRTWMNFFSTTLLWPFNFKSPNTIFYIHKAKHSQFKEMELSLTN